MKHTLLRQWALLRLIPRAPRKIDVRSLQKRLEDAGYAISVRSIQRDLNAFSAELPLLADDAKPQGWSWSADAQSLDFPFLQAQPPIVPDGSERHLDALPPYATRDAETRASPAAGAADGESPARAPASSDHPRMVQVVARFTAAAIERLRDDAFGAGHRIEPAEAGQFRVTFVAPDSVQLQWWLQAFGDQVIVLDPPALRARMLRSARAMLTAYADLPMAWCPDGLM